MKSFSKNFYPYAKPSLTKEDCDEVETSLQKETITRGEKVHQFEEALKKETGADYCVVINSGSTALEAAYFAAEGGPQDRILTTPNSFVATVGSGIRRQMTPCFVDIDRKTGNMSLAQTLLNLDYPSSRGKLVVVPVHFAGIAFDMKALQLHLRDPKAVVIEDAAHALGSYYPSGEKVGSCCYSDMTIFSFHPAKNITTGEGGAITTNNPDLYERLIRFRNNGIVRREAVWDYDVTAFTGNYNFTDFQAALGLSQLERLDSFVSHRRKLVKRYRAQFQGYKKVTLFSEAQDDLTAFHLFVIQVNFPKMDRTRFMNALLDKGIGSQLHYLPLYRHTAFKEVIGDVADYFPEMEAYSQTALSLPLYYDLQEEEVDHIVTVVKSLLKG